MDDRPLIEKVLDVVLYAPVGLATQLRTDLPKLVVDGRSELESRVKVAHWVGEMTVQFGRRALEQRLADRRRPATSSSIVSSTATDAPPTTMPSAEVRHPPFEGYDQLAAAQIVQLLGRLPHGELHLVREFETTHRQRRTVLAKIDQLLGE
jgi:hypothetical protein